MEPAPVCSRCNKALNDWVGNIMVDRNLYGVHPSRISNLCVVCKPCTRELDRSGEGRAYHNFWELRWIKDSPMSYVGGMLQDLLVESKYITKKWDAEAVREIAFLVALTLPYEQGRSFMKYLNPAEWDHDGPYSNRLREAHGLSPIDE